jgi:hypothetical protein
MSFSFGSPSASATSVNSQAARSDSGNRPHIPNRLWVDIVEENPAQEVRPVYLKFRPLRGAVNNDGVGGLLYRTVSKFPTSGHWAIEYGSYTYELCMHDRKPICFHGFWEELSEAPTKRIKVGESDFTDEKARYNGELLI